MIIFKKDNNIILIKKSKFLKKVLAISNNLWHSNSNSDAAADYDK